MLHVGNDIVDLLHPTAMGKSRDIPFLKRVFLPEEERLIIEDPEPDVMLWALWTCKEAAYKVVQKEFLHVSSAPRRYRVTFAPRTEPKGTAVHGPGDRFFSGTVDTPGGKIGIQTVVNQAYVHSLAMPLPYAGAFELVLHDVKRLPFRVQPSPRELSFHVREAARDHLARYLGCPGQDIDIRRTRGERGLDPPVVYCREKRAALDISISHDGFFTAYAFTGHCGVSSGYERSNLTYEIGEFLGEGCVVE